jgi:hypothetical protein
VLELALAAKNFGQRPCVLHGFDVDSAEPSFLEDFDLTCNLRLMLWDAFIAKKQAEAMKGDDGEKVQQVPLDVIPEFSIENVSEAN